MKKHNSDITLALLMLAVIIPLVIDAFNRMNELSVMLGK
jgi:hypothetical protein